MTYFDDIYEFAVDNHYLITTADARDIGVPPVELAKLANRGRLQNISRGVYRLARFVPSQNDAFAVAVAQGGRGAYLFGESVIGMLGLAPTNPSRIFVAVPRRVRSKLSGSALRFVQVKTPGQTTFYDGIASQRAADAIAACVGSLMPERLTQAAHAGAEAGYVTRAELAKLIESGVVDEAS